MKRTEKGNLVIVVDDDYRMREALENLLESVGYTVRTFSSAEQFLDSHIFETSNCVISDVKMPGMDGIHLKERIQSMEPYLPVILISADPSPPVNVKTKEHEWKFWFSKPFDCHELIDAIEEVSRRSSRPE
jgi:FixJ family two-component response regulator